MKRGSDFVGQKRIFAGIVLLMAGILLTAAGIVLKQYEGVWRKAIFICMECIGLG